jgi:hypothetical protein
MCAQAKSFKYLGLRLLQELADFHSIYSHGFIRGAVCLPHMRVADSMFNTNRTLALAQRAAGTYAVLALLELSVFGCSNEDLFHQDILLEPTRMSVARIVEPSVDLSPVLLIGAPLRFGGKLFNWAVVTYWRTILGIAPKTYLPNYREFYEKRQFNSGRNAVRTETLSRPGSSFWQRLDIRSEFSVGFHHPCRSLRRSLPYDLLSTTLRYGLQAEQGCVYMSYASSYKSHRNWPDHLAADKHREYDLPTI